MKKYIVTLAITALATAAFAQGTVVLQNNNLGWVQQWTSSLDPTLKHVPVGQGHVELLGAAAGTALANPLGTLGASGFTANYTTLASFLGANPGWSAVGTATTAGVAGLFNGGELPIPGVAVGAGANYILIGWTGSATTYDSAYQIAGTFFGQSTLATTLTGGSGTPPSTGVNLNATFTGITMAPLSAVPEPSTFALAGLGAAALLIFRRRK